MKTKVLNNDRQKTYALVLYTGDRVIAQLSRFAKEQGLQAAQFTAIGALSNATLGFFDFEIKDYRKIQVEEQVEVLSVIGDITTYKNEPKIHAHIVVGKKDGTAHGGHLIEATVSPTLEIILTESPAYLKRKMNESVGLPLIDIEENSG